MEDVENYLRNKNDERDYVLQNTGTVTTIIK